MAFTIEQLSLSPWESSFMPLRIDSPEEVVNTLETEADEQTLHYVEGRRAAYKSQVRAQIGHLRAVIIEMRTKGSNNAEINEALRGLKEQFHHSMSRFAAGKEEYSEAKEEAVQRNQARRAELLHSLDSSSQRIMNVVVAAPTAVRIAAVRSVAEVLGGAYQGIKFTAEKVCALDPVMGEVCNQSKQLVQQGAALVAEHTPNFVRVAVNQVAELQRSHREDEIAFNQRFLDIPAEQTRQYHHNVDVVGMGVLGVGGVLSATKVVSKVSRLRVKPKGVPPHLQQNGAEFLGKPQEVDVYTKGDNFVVRTGMGSRLLKIEVRSKD